MAIRDRKLLLDIAIRLQVFAEGVKASEARIFDLLLIEVEEEFKKLLTRVNFNTLDSLTKRELTKLVLALRETQSKVYSLYLNKVLKRLELFMRASLKVQRIVYAWSHFALEEDNEDLPVMDDDEAALYIIGAAAFPFLFGKVAAFSDKGDRLWPKIINEPIPSSGALLKPFLTSLSASAQVGLENTVRKGYANALTPGQTIREATKHLNRVKGQATSVMGTSMQHIASVVSASITSGLYGRYKWLSVIDGSTTDICLSRSNRIYDYGSGPLPPAHINCRSSIQPYNGVDTEPETFYSWIKRQTPFFQNFALGNKGGELLRTEKLKAKDVTRLTNPKEMTIETFANSAEQIITGEE